MSFRRRIAGCACVKPFKVLSIMKSGNNWLTIIIVFVVGGLLIVWHARVDILSWIVVAVGLMLVIPGLYSLISAMVRKKDDGQINYSASSASIVASVGAMALGAWMLIQPTFFVGLLAYIFAALLILYGIFHIIVIGFWAKPIVLPMWFYVIPVLMIVAGVVLLCTSVRTLNSAVVLITGIALVASAVNSLLEMVSMSPARTRQQLPE